MAPPEPEEAPPTEAELLAVALLLAELRPALLRLVRRRYGAVTLTLRGASPEINERKTYPPEFDLFKAS